MISAKTAVLYVAAFLTALTAGLLFAYSCSVNPGLHRLPDVAYLQAMQEINRVILNPAFFTCFLGPVLLLPIGTWLYFTKPASTTFWRLFLAMTLYLAGTFGVTMLGNVPLNDALNGFDIAQASPQQLMAQRMAFEKPWNGLHFVRTIAAMLSLALILAGISSSNQRSNVGN